MQYLWNILLTIDQGANTVLAPVLNGVLKPKYAFGYPDETMSSVFGKNSGQCYLCRVMCRALNWFETDHCNKSVEADEGNS